MDIDEETKMRKVEESFKNIVSLDKENKIDDDLIGLFCEEYEQLFE